MKRSLLKVVALLFVLAGFALAQQPVNNAQVAGATTSTAASGVQKVGIVGATGTALDGTTAGVVDANVKTINNVTPLMGNGTTGTGSQRVTIASDNTAFSVNATLGAETTKTIGVVRNADGAGNLLTSNSTTYTAKFGFDSNLLGTLGTAFSTAGKVDVKGADGDVFVRQTTGTNLHAVLDTTSTTAATQGTAANLKMAMSGNAGGVMDFVGQNAAQPANSLLIGGEFNTSPTTITNGDASPLQLDSSGKLLVNCTGCSAGSTVSLIPATTGGLLIAHLIAAATNNATVLKGSAGQLYGASVYNNTTYPVYLKFCNKATACTCGTNTGSDTILYTVAAQAGTEREIHTEEGIAFGTGIGYCVVKGMADTDNTSLVASDAVVDLLYK